MLIKFGWTIVLLNINLLSQVHLDQATILGPHKDWWRIILLGFYESFLAFRAVYCLYFNFPLPFICILAPIVFISITLLGFYPFFLFQLYSLDFIVFISIFHCHSFASLLLLFKTCSFTITKLIKCYQSEDSSVKSHSSYLCYTTSLQCHLAFCNSLKKYIFSLAHHLQIALE